MKQPMLKSNSSHPKITTKNSHIDETPSSAYWDEIIDHWQPEDRHLLWRTFANTLHRNLVKKTLKSSCFDHCLKTDLFEESVSEGVLPAINEVIKHVVGIDLSHNVLNGALSNHTDLSGIQTDVRALPFKDHQFDIIISFSTLDHFSSTSMIEQSLAELYRVLKPGGNMMVTLDNPINPIIALRSALSSKMLHRFGIVPYYVGKTIAARKLKKTMKLLGFQIVKTKYFMHIPRFPVIKTTRVLPFLFNKKSKQSLFIKFLTAFEVLSILPTSCFTGQFYVITVKKH